MDKAEIIRRLENIANHAVHVIGEEPFIIGLDDGIAVIEAITALKEQDPILVDTKIIGMPDGNDIEVNCCRKCRSVLDPTFNYCPHCGKEIKWNE